MRCFIIVSLLAGLFLVAQTPNHNAVLITGETPEGAEEKIQNALESGDTLNDSLALWGLKEAMESEATRPIDEFWNDTYLMWELLYNKDWSDENIHLGSHVSALNLQLGNLFLKYFISRLKIRCF